MNKDFLREFGIEGGITFASKPINRFILLEGANLPNEIRFPIPDATSYSYVSIDVVPTIKTLEIVYLRIRDLSNTISIYEYHGWSVNE